MEEEWSAAGWEIVREGERRVGTDKKKGGRSVVEWIESNDEVGGGTGGSQGTGQYTGFVSYACVLKMCKAKAKAQKAVQAGLALSSGGR